MSLSTNSPYYLLTQLADGLVIIGMQGKSTCLRRTAAEILAEPKVLAGLPAKDKALIENIATISSINAKPRTTRKKVK